MKKYLLPSLLVLALSASFAIAQSITKALQLSQDATGAFGVDTTNGVYFPGHVLSASKIGTPTVAGTGTPTVVGTDTAGTITMGATATTATLTFAQAYVSVPWCLVSMNGNATTTISYTVATTSLAITASGAVGVNNKPTYFCTSAS